MLADRMPTWPEALAAPAYVISLARRPDRLAFAVRALRAAGFSNLTHVAAVDGQDHNALAAAWAALGSPTLSDPWQVEPQRYAGEQGCLLSHLLLWEELAHLEHPFAWVFEDDIHFAPCWSALAPLYFARSQPPWDILYAGSHSWHDLGQRWIVRVPVYCTHAYLITPQGAQRLQAVIRAMPTMFPIDMMLAERQQAGLAGQGQAGFDWVVWHGQQYHGEAATGATGLVLQDRGRISSDIR
jgi:GR25 family glycosyltransferase involved in LPS biosynthesis